MNPSSRTPVVQLSLQSPTIHQVAAAGEYKSAYLDQTLVWHMQNRKKIQDEVAAREAALAEARALREEAYMRALAQWEAKEAASR